MESDRERHHYPSPTRHHSCNSNSPPSLSEKRLIRRAFQGTPYPQTISIPPPLSSSPLSLNTANVGPSSATVHSIFSPRLSERPYSALLPPPTPSPSSTPRTPTSSLVRRRRLSAASGGPPSINSSSVAATPSFHPLLSSTSSDSIMAQRNSAYDSFQSDPHKTPGPGPATNFFEFGRQQHINIGGHATSKSREKHTHVNLNNDDDQIGQLLEFDLQMMEDEPSDEDVADVTDDRELKNPVNGLSMGRAQDSPDDALARIAQAMNLLSLQPPNGPLQSQQGYFTSPGELPELEPPWPPHPTPENLLRESLRHSLDAYKTLKMLDNAMVNGSVARERKTSRSQSVKTSESEGGGSGRADCGSSYHDVEGLTSGEISIVEVMQAYDQAGQGIRTARELLSWAEHWIGEERDRARERLLKG